MSVDARRPASDYWRHDPRVDPPTKKDRRRLLLWICFLGITPICLGVMVWAALDLNGGYPTVQPPVPAGWQSVPGIYASFSVPKSWSLRQYLSDAAGDVYYAGPGGGAGESVVQADGPPKLATLPQIVGTFLGGRYTIARRSSYPLRHAAEAWQYIFKLPAGREGIGIVAWVKQTSTEVWLIVSPGSKTTRTVLSTLALAS